MGAQELMDGLKNIVSGIAGDTVEKLILFMAVHQLLGPHST